MLNYTLNFFNKNKKILYNFKGHFLYIDASEEPYFYGVLIDTDGFSQLSNLAQINLELYDFPNNRQLWEKRYIHPEYFINVRANGTIIQQACTDVYDFPFLSERFCEELIQIMENYGQWSDGSNKVLILKFLKLYMYCFIIRSNFVLGTLDFSYKNCPKNF